MVYLSAMHEDGLVGQEVIPVAVAKGKTRVTVTLDGDLYDRLVELAERESRSLSGQIRHELKKSVLVAKGRNGDRR